MILPALKTYLEIATFQWEIISLHVYLTGLVSNKDWVLLFYEVMLAKHWSHTL